MKERFTGIANWLRPPKRQDYLSTNLEKEAYAFVHRVKGLEMKQCLLTGCERTLSAAGGCEGRDRTTGEAGIVKCWIPHGTNRLTRNRALQDWGTGMVAMWGSRSQQKGLSAESDRDFE
jgi:hypothetical protein